MITWFEIPVADMARAKSFYETVLGAPMKQGLDLDGIKMQFFPDGSGTLVQHEAYTPSYQGTLIYLDGGNDLAPMLGRVEIAGGKVLRDKTKISDAFGYMALFEDTEGNRMALRNK